MAEKGENGFSPKGKTSTKGKIAGKSIPKKQGSLKGKDTTTSKRTKRVLIESLDSDSEGFIEGNSQSSPKLNEKTPSDLKSGKKKVSVKGLKSGGKASPYTPSSTVSENWDKAGSGKAHGKGSLPRATRVKVPLSEVVLKLELELPNDARVLMDCEAADVLQGIQDHLTVTLEDPNIKVPESFNKALEYSKINNHYTSVLSAREILQTLKSSGVTDGEMCMIGNILPEKVNEVYALIPSLQANRHNNEKPISDALAELAKLKSLE